MLVMHVLHGVPRGVAQAGRSLLILAMSFLVALPGAALRTGTGRWAGSPVVAFCLRPPAAGQIRWTPSAGTAPPVLQIAVRGLPAATNFGIFVDEGTAHAAYDAAHFRTGPTGAAALAVRAFRPLPAQSRRLLLESFNGTTTVVRTVAYPCGSGAVPRPSATLLRTVPVEVSPFAVAVDAAVGRVLVLNAQRTPPSPRGTVGSVSVLDARTGAVLGRVVVGRGPSALAVDMRTTHAFVSNGHANTVSMLDTRAARVLRTVTVGTFPSVLAIDPQTMRVFVANGGSSTVSVLDARSGQVVRTVRVSPGPAAIAVDAPTNRAFVVSRVGWVNVLDARSGQVVRTVAVGRFLRTATVDAVTGRVFVADVCALTAQTTPLGPGAIHLLDARTGTLVRTVTVGTGPFALAVDEPATRVFVTNLNSASVSVLDARTGTLLRTVAVGQFPMALAVDIQTGRVFVANRTSDSVSILNATNGRVVRTVAVGAGVAAAPSAVAVDARTGRAFVANTDANSVSVLDATR